MFHDLSQMQDYYIYYRRDAQDLLSFLYASDNSFNNLILNHKSFQGYIIKLFGKAVV